MDINRLQTTAFSDTKKHFGTLDGLRGVAAIMVVIYHLFEAFSGGSRLNQIVNHGYLAVDFFFVLSGFVIGYAYDDRWDNMSVKGFIKRRLIRLHPMIIAGMITGAIAFYFSSSAIVFPHISQVSFISLMLVMLIGFTLLPLPVSMDIRGWSEMYPLNGPAWSLLFEYFANLIYALVIRKFSNRVLLVFVVISACVLFHYSVFGPKGDVIGGWSLNPRHLHIGFIRLLYPFFAGLLISRTFRPKRVIKHAFLWCSLMVVVILSVPRIGGSEHLWMNGLYDALSIIFLFPLIVCLGASGEVQGRYLTKLSGFLSDISYPIYIIHYPLIYVFMAWAIDNRVPLKDAWPAGGFVLLGAVGIAYMCLKYYDIPVRRWLSKL